jgi:thiol peroxidase
LDTGVCATSTKKFNDNAEQHSDTVFLTISADLPFAQGRFCEAETIKNLRTLSMMRSKDFATDYGVLISDGPLAGISSRAVVVLDADNKIIYTELVPEIVQEPNYDSALAAL